MTVVAQIAFLEILAQPSMTLDVVRRQIPLLAGIQGVEVRMHRRCTRNLSLIRPDQVVSGRLILSDSGRRRQRIRRRRLRVAHQIVALGRILMSGWGLRIRREGEEYCDTQQGPKVSRLHCNIPSM